MTSLTLLPLASGATLLTRWDLTEPEATHQFERYPWLHLPPGAVPLLFICTAGIFFGALHSCIASARRIGLPHRVVENVTLSLEDARSRWREEPLSDLPLLRPSADATSWSRGERRLR